MPRGRVPTWTVTKSRDPVEIEHQVQDKVAKVYVPNSWKGKRVRVTLLD